MKAYSESLKKQVVREYLRGDKRTAEILGPRGIPKSNLYRWLKKYAPDYKEHSKKEFTYKNFYQMQLRVEYLESLVSILQKVECTVSSPLPDKLHELEKLQGQYSVHALCSALDVSRGTFYNFIKRNKRNDTSYAKRRESLRLMIQEIFDESHQTYGAGKIAAVIKNRNIPISIEMVRELMREMGLLSIRYGAKTIAEKEEAKRAGISIYKKMPDKPDQIWVGDITYFKLNNQEFYICVILDLYSRKVIAYKIGKQCNTYLAKSTFLKAFAVRSPKSGLIFHSDQGSCYTSYTYQHCLKEHHVQQSFSRAHHPQDNSAMESFFSSFKREQLYRIQYKSVREFIESVDKYMDEYNRVRLHSRLHYNTPNGYEDDYYQNNKEEKNIE